MKDNFSVQSSQYVKFRPGYPPGVYELLFSLVAANHTAWDCATGNGQIAAELSRYFKRVVATDISKTQLENAFQAPNILYKLESAEDAAWHDNSFDLITVGQAIHWFDFEQFYVHVRRTAKPGGIFAVMGYGLVMADKRTNTIIQKLHTDIVGPYWDEERRYIDEEYQTIPFPFKEIKVPAFQNRFVWTFDHLIGYLNTWSAVQHYIRIKGTNPLDLIYTDMKDAWEKNPEKLVCFPILMRVARL